MTPKPTPSFRRRILLTRSEEDCAEWAAQFVERGAEPVALPCIRCEPIGTPDVRRELAAAVPTADWLVFTSRRGVGAFTALDAPTPNPGCRVAVVGEATAAAALAALGRVDLVGAGTAAALAAALAAHGDWQRRPNVVLVLAENAGDVLPRALAAAGAHCTRIDVYRTVAVRNTEPRRPLSALRVDNVVFASPSAVEGLVQQVELDVPVAVYTIGPSTTAAARRAGLVVTAEAREPSLKGILEAIEWLN